MKVMFTQEVPKVVVVGSANFDMFLRTRKLPSPGETVIASSFQRSCGGKGANQAVAVARLGGQSIIVARLGEDEFGEKLMENFQKFGVDTRFVIHDSGASSGNAFVILDEQGENVVVVYPGANAKLDVTDLDPVIEEIKTSGVVVVQLEIPIPTVRKLASITKKYNVPFILNPAPVPREGITEILPMVNVLCPNQTEAQSLTGIRIDQPEDAFSAARKLREMGAESIVITLGPQGAILVSTESEEYIPATPVTVRDRTGAGDAFVGGLSFALAAGWSITKSVIFATNVAALSVTKVGTQSGLPTYEEVTSFLKR